MQRRDVLRLLGLVPLAAALPDLALAAAPHGGYGKVLVLVELKGGNDGLNTVVPHADPAYRALRPRLAVPSEEVVPLTSSLGLHPALAPLGPLWQGGELAIVQGVGYPEPNLSHFRSIEIWDTASKADEYLAEGWLTRLFRAHPAPAHFAAEGVVVGSQELGPLAGGGSRAIALADTERFQRQARRFDAGVAASGNPALTHLLKVERDIQQAANGLGGGPALHTEFPRSALGHALRTAAAVIVGRAPVAAVRVSHAGYDTHSNQPATHRRLLGELAEGLVAFRAAMQESGRWNDVLVMTYSEFGRRPRENGSLGTDHGTANVHFVLGGRVRGGLYGDPPSLTRLEDDNLVHTLDFRRLYATVIERWWGFDSRDVLGGRFAPLELVRA